MIIISMCFLVFTSKNMKKVLSVLLLSLFTLFSISPLLDVALATWEATPDAAKRTELGDSEIWINFWNGCLTKMWRGCFHYEKIIWIAGEQPDYTATSIAQDVIFAATYMVWTVLTVVMIYCWLWYVLAAKWGNNTDKYKTWLINSAIWAVLVWWAYAIVRLIQYIAKW